MREFSVIHHYFQHCTDHHTYTHVGIGDDCAVSHIPAHMQLVSCVDTLVAGRHFPTHTHPHAIGWKSVAVNLSDIASMGATPYAILLALSLPHVDQDWLAEFSRGLQDCCKKYNVQLIGGDTTQSPTLTISITALGYIPKGKSIHRHGANVGDYICVSGEIGSASYALADALAQRPNPVQNALDYPQPQVELGTTLIDFASAMIDISDGLAQDLSHILTASQVGAILHLEHIPCANVLQTLPEQQRWQHILAGGDDYQLCFTISPEKYQQLQQQHACSPPIIGTITADPQLVYLHQQRPISLHFKGYQHFEPTA